MAVHPVQSFLRFALALTLCLPSLAMAENLTLHVGTLVAVPGEAPLSDRTVVVEGDRIVSATVIDGLENLVQPTT